MESTKQNTEPTTKDKQKENKPFVREKGAGIVKAVLTGDTIVVTGREKTGGPPREREITLANITAPRFGRKKSEKKPEIKDEPFAWASRESLRKRVIGKNVSFTIEYRTPQSKEFGNIKFLSADSEGDNIAKDHIANGWAKVRRPSGKGEIPRELEQLIQLEEKAQSEGKGIWEKSEGVINASIRNFKVIPPMELFEQVKGKALSGVVEKVLTGSMMKVTLFPSLQNVTLQLSGVEAPMIQRSGEAAPFGREAKYLTEHYLLNRDIQLIIEGVDKFNLYGTVSYEGHYIGEELLKNGLAKYVDWSGQRTNVSPKYKAAEKLAQEKRGRIWQDYSAPKPLSRQEEKKLVKPGSQIVGNVLEIVNGGTILVNDGKEDHRISFSSVTPLRQTGNFEKQMKNERKKEVSEEKEKAHSPEAKEYLRKKLIGQRVRCVLDYIKTSEEKDRPDKFYYSVYFEKNNVAVEVVSQGLAFAQSHRGTDMRSADYEDILKAESLAKNNGKGVWNSKETPVHHVNDISLLNTPKEVAKARQFLPSLKRAGKQRGVVEFVFSGSRLKVFIPKEGCQIAFALAGIRCPGKADPFGKEAHQFSKELARQRDVEFEVLSQDRLGTFVGNLWVSKKNLATSLLEKGFAFIHQGSIKDTVHSTEYLIAEESAKKTHLNVWQDYDEQAVAEERRKRDEEKNTTRQTKQELIDVIVTEVVDGTSFFVQIIGNEAEQLDELMSALSMQGGDPYKPNIGDLVAAQFTVDDAWYRAKVLSSKEDTEFQVQYIDYGNMEMVPISRIRKLDPKFTRLAPQAVESHLAYIKTPAVETELGQEAANTLRQMALSKSMLANVEYKANNALYLSLGDRESLVLVNAALLRAGLARVERVRGKNLAPLMEKLKDEESKARSAHLNIWEYGDPGSDEEDTPKKRGGKR